MESSSRPTGLDGIGDQAWGAHFCLFYETREDLIDLLVPYLKAGLENHEFCLCVASEPLIAAEAERALRTAVPDFQRHFEQGQIEIIPHRNWYLQDGDFDPLRVRQGWIDKLEQGRARGFAGMRFAANAGWLERQDWQSFAEYEAKLSQTFEKLPIMAVCAYALTRCLPSDILDVVQHHQFTLIRRHGDWERIDGPELQRAHAEIRKLNATLERRVEDRTSQLAATIAELEQEIAERQRIEETLREREEFLRCLMDNTFEFINLSDAAGKVVYANSAVERFLGTVPARITDWVHPEDRDAKLRWFARILAGGKEFLRWRVRHQSGEWRWMESQGTVVPFRGSPHVLAVCRDETENVRAEEALRENGRKLYTAQRLAHIGYWERDLLADRSTPSEESCSIFGLRAGTVLSQAELQTIIHPDDRELQSRALAEARQGRHPYDVEYRIIRPDGDIRFLHVWDRVIKDETGRPIRMFGTLQDITDNKRAEQSLRENQRLLQSVLATLPVGVAVTDVAGNIILVNATSKRIWGEIVISGQERRARSIGFWHETGQRIEPDSWASLRALRDGQTILNELIDIETFDRQKKIVQNSAAPVRNDDGAIVGAVIVNEDVTERVLAEEAGRERERDLAEAQRVAHLGNWSFDIATNTLRWSDELYRIFDIDKTDFAGTFEAFVSRVHAEDRNRVVQVNAGAKSTGEPFEIEYRIAARSGQVKHVREIGYSRKDQVGTVTRLFGTAQDVTERKRAEAALREYADRLQHLSRRMLAVQEEERRHLARELHDEFAQLLAAISLHLHAAKRVAGEAARPQLDECTTLLQSAGEQVRSLALELRPTMLEMAGLDAALRRLAEQHMQRTGIATEVVGHANHVSGELAIACYRIVQEALTNVARHARASHVWIEMSQNEKMLELAVRDDGIGFDVAKCLGQVASRGSLGLLGMRERVELLGGSLEVDSAPERGTRIHAHFPLPEAASEPNGGVE